MTKNKTREAPLPRPDKGVNDARPGLPTSTVRQNVTWVQPEPTTSDITRPQTAEPRHNMGRTQHRIVQACERGPRVSQPLGTRLTSRHPATVRFSHVIPSSC